MMPTAKVVYPTPPPTTNNLTTRQRSLLVRKAKKIEQILGYPPLLIDTLPDGRPASSLSDPKNFISGHRSSIESSSSSFIYPDSLRDKDGSCYPNQSRDSAFFASHDHGLSQIPLLRVSSDSLRLEVTAVTNWPAQHDGPDSELQLKSSLTDPVIVVPTFTIPSSHAHRKAKMDRIRKRLGSEVPYDVVFPEEVEQGPKHSSGNPLPKRKDAAMNSVNRPSPTLSPGFSSTSSHRHLESRHLSLIPESPDETAGGYQELTMVTSRIKDGNVKRRDTADSHPSACPQSSGSSLRRRPSSYRKPPPPMLDSTFCSF